MIVGGLIVAGASIASSLLNSGAQHIAANEQKNNEKELLDYQMKKYNSPQAQVNNLGAAGVNPAVAFGNNSPVLNSGGSFGGLSLPDFGIGTSSMSDLASYIQAAASAKKAGVETKSVEKTIENQSIQNEREQFELLLRQKYGLGKAAADLALAQENVSLAKQKGDINDLDKALKQWSVAKEKAVSQAEETKRDILIKELANTDKRLDLENAESDARRRASEASAAASYSLAALNNENRRLQSALADIEEAGKSDKIAALISKYQADGSISDADAEEAKIKYERLCDIDNKRSTFFFREVDDFTEWLKSKISIFK